MCWTGIIKYDNKEKPDKIFSLQSTNLRIKKILKALEWCAGEQLCAHRGFSTSPSVTYYLSWVKQIEQVLKKNSVRLLVYRIVQRIKNEGENHLAVKIMHISGL